MIIVLKHFSYLGEIKRKISITDEVNYILKNQYENDKLFNIHETVRIPIFEVIEDLF